MNKKFVVAIVLIGLMIAGIITFQMQNRVAQEAVVETAVPTQDSASENTSRTIDFELPDIDGKVRQLSEWNGKARLVNFWATWCAPCRREIPLLKATQAAHGDAGVQIIGIAVDFPDEVAAYAEEAEFNYPILVGQEEAMAAAEASGIEFIGMPFTMVIAPDGELLTTHIGEIVEAHIDTILGVFADLNAGTIDNAGARESLQTL
ncbi:MAG: peroxiredoxin [Woeseiaceae bacterium]|jgi:peroxiredoxin